MKTPHPTPDASPAWHALPVADTLHALSVVAAAGLSQQDVAERLEKYGPNSHCVRRLAPPRMMKENTSGWKRQRSSNDMAVAPRCLT
jgi:hypothetical protein